MNIPLCLGMPRSASRMTWQIVKKLVPPTPPAGWYPDIVSEWMEDSEYSPEEIARHQWPLRGHDYLPGPPVVYTFRHPIEAYLSLRSRYRTDVGKMVPGASGKKIIAGEEITIVDPQNMILMTAEQADHLAMVGVGTHWDVWQRLKKDAEGGRKCLFLKYEEYHHRRDLRIQDIASFVGVPLTESHAAEIYEYTSLENNAKRGQDPRFYENDKVTFSHGFLGKSGMQKEHINPTHRGEPGAYIKNHPKFARAVRCGMVPALQALKEMCEDMGYDL